MITPLNYLQKTSSFSFIKLFNKHVSKKIIEDIHSGNKINFNNELLASQKENILKLEKKYKEKKIFMNEKPRNWIFWEIIKDSYIDYEIKFIEKKSSNISNKSKFKKNICNTTFTKKIGFNPSIIALIIFEKQIKKELERYSDSFFSCAKFWPPNDNELDKIKSTLKKKMSSSYPSSVLIIRLKKLGKISILLRLRN